MQTERVPSQTERVPSEMIRKIEQRWATALKRDADRWRRGRSLQSNVSYMKDRNHRPISVIRKK